MWPGRASWRPLSASVVCHLDHRGGFNIFLILSFKSDFTELPRLPFLRRVSKFISYSRVRLKWNYFPPDGRKCKDWCAGAVGVPRLWPCALADSVGADMLGWSGLQRAGASQRVGDAKRTCSGSILAYASSRRSAGRYCKVTD